MADQRADRDTVWDLERLTASTRSLVPMAEHTQIEVIHAERGRVRLRMPFEGNTNHISTMYAGALFTLAEIPGGTLFSTTFDASRYYPVVKGMEIQFRRPATTAITVEATMAQNEAQRIATEADANGKADYDLDVELIDAEGTVVARSTNHYQLRAHP